MFEEEAKKWVKENSRIEHSASFGEIAVEPSAEKGFQKGAEFGYNKANEWHYVKDELPRITKIGYWSNDLIFLTKDCSGNITKHFGYFDFRKEFKEYNTEDEFTLDKVIAWKEIVLPKESE